MFVKLALIAIGGGLGALARFGLHEFGAHLFGRTFNVGILAANVVGSLLLGFVGALAIEKFAHVRDDVHLALTVGFLGGLTTFSTLAFETMREAQEGRWGMAGLNMGANVVLGLAGALLGWWIAMRVFGN